MSKNDKETLWIYQIDKNDTISEVSDNFLAFATHNGWQAGNIIGQSIFDFIDGLEISHLYRLLFTKVRGAKTLGLCPFVVTHHMKDDFWKCFYILSRTKKFK